MAINFGSKERQKLQEGKLTLSKEEAVLLINLIAEGNVQIKNIQSAYDLVLKVQTFIQKQ
tara:strand:- start:21762 stop:21941 length:180 start_codon:yes stop_codon:yes gene_type:complete